jgi:hypothetical protein
MDEALAAWLCREGCDRPSARLCARVKGRFSQREGDQLCPGTQKLHRAARVELYLRETAPPLGGWPGDGPASSAIIIRNRSRRSSIGTYKVPLQIIQ